VGAHDKEDKTMKRLVALLSRKPGMSMEDFRAYYEGNHAPLILSLLPEGVEYRRTYVDPTTLFGGSVSNPSEAPVLDFDVITTLSFATEELYTAARASLGTAENQARIGADEENFLDRPAKRIFVTTDCFEG